MSINLKVWWIPQIPMKAFEIPVSSVEEGRKICDILAQYDLFQYENRVKGDYCNAGGVVFQVDEFTDDEDGNPDWWDVPDDDDEWNDILEEIASIEKKVSKPI